MKATANDTEDQKQKHAPSILAFLREAGQNTCASISEPAWWPCCSYVPHTLYAYVV